MKAIMSLAEFVSVWQGSHPHDVVVKGEAEAVSWWALAGVLVSLVAANILSAAHTIPVIVETVKTDIEWLKFVVAIAGFLAVEFVILMFMIFGKSGWIRTGIILLALTVAIVANVGSTMLQVTAGGVYGAGGVIVGVVLGLFAPLANVGIGEVFRGMLDKTNAENKRIDKQYADDLNAHDAKVRGQYSAYLKKMGVTDATEALTYMTEGKQNEKIVSNPVDVQTNNAPIGAPLTHSNPVSHTRIKKVSRTATKRASIGPEGLAELMRRDGTQDESYRKLTERYKVSPTTISAAKKLL